VECPAVILRSEITAASLEATIQSHIEVLQRWKDLVRVNDFLFG
jgi:hypothetical protein